MEQTTVSIVTTLGEYFTAMIGWVGEVFNDISNNEVAL